MLRNSLQTLIGRNYSFEQRSSGHASAEGEVAGAWSAYAELGLLALGLPEEFGGLPASLADIGMVAQMLGGAMALEPYRPAMVAARLLAELGSHEQKANLLPQIVEGSLRVVLAHEEGDGRLRGNNGTTATAGASGWHLSGAKSVVAGGDKADLFIVSARIGDEAALFLVPAERVRRRSYRCFDWTGGADIDLDGVIVEETARLAGGAAELAKALDEATALACADAVGAIKAANLLVREHTSTRRQFGKSLDSFQVLQHRLVDMAIAEELAGPITEAALSACDCASVGERAKAVSAAKVKVGESARLVGQQVVQLHGGMGLTQEYPASHLFARLGLFERSHGDRDDHLERYAKLMSKLAS